MVHIPNDDEETPTQQNKRPPSQQVSRTPTGQNRRPPAQKTPTGQSQRPPSDQSRRPTGKPKQQSNRPTGPSSGNTSQKRRSTQMLSLEPPKRRRGPSLAKGGTRMDSLGSPATKSQRNQNLFGKVGREEPSRPQQAPRMGGAEGQRPRVRRESSRQGPVNLGGSAKEVDSMIVRRKSTRRIPKKGGGIEGEASPLDSMGSGRRPPVTQPPPRSPRHVDPGPAERDVPPVVDMPVPQSRVPQGPKAPPDSNRGNTLAGVSAEDLLGEEGRQLLENMRRRETEESGRPAQGTVPQPQQPLAPRDQDSSRMAFQSAEYATEAPEQADDELRPQDSFLSGPTRQIQREVVQTPMPVDAPKPQSDDLGYEKPIDFGDGGKQQVVEDDEDPVARESVAHDEMEQRAGYLLWLQGVITREEVEDAIAAEGDAADALIDLVADSAFTDQITLYRFLARHESVSPVDLEHVEPSEKALASLRPAIARAYRVVPFGRFGDILLVATTFPFDPKRLLELRRLTASKVKLFVVTEEEIDLALTKFYPGGAVTVRSPKPEGIEDVAEDAAADESDITGEGESLVTGYDPTLSGEDSGLYAPLDGAEESESHSPSDVGLSEIDDDAAGDELGEDVNDTLDEVAIGNSGDLDESTLDSGDNDMKEGDELDLSDPSDDAESDAEDEYGEQERKLDTGPEDLDPFAD